METRFGGDLVAINTALDDLRVHLPQWFYTFPMFQLMEETAQYLSKNGNSMRKDKIINVIPNQSKKDNMSYVKAQEEIPKKDIRPRLVAKQNSQHTNLRHGLQITENWLHT